MLWGVGGLTFGLSMRYLGVALGQSIALGTCAAFGTLLPALFGGADLLHGQGLVLLISTSVTDSGHCCDRICRKPARTQYERGGKKKAAVKDFALTKGILVALLAGVMSACFNLGLESGIPILEAAKAGGANELSP